MAARPKAAYHHGDLKEALLRATVALIEARGVEDFSLREVARAAGVSPRAPYHHFENRAALLALIAQEGFELLAGSLAHAASRAATAAEAARHMVQAYVAFAEAHRAHFMVMFRPGSYDKAAHPEVADAGDRAMAVLAAALAPALPSARDRAQLLVLAWAVAHGAASLLLDGALARRSALMGLAPADLVEGVARLFERLLTAAPPLNGAR